MSKPWLRAVLFVCLCTAWTACIHSGLGAEDIPAYQALVWDQPTTLPPGSYRSVKPIDVVGDFIISTVPNTQIEGVQFHTQGGVQQWVLKGTVFRRVAITGKRVANGQATDCVFEDFQWDKDDNWYSFWWSTRWYFNNCIFTKKFLRGDLPPLDYSAHATNCTFYSVKLPSVGFKEDPASYMGKDPMVFEHCRFVDCDVPQTLLASTVDCVFENCRFEPKNKVAWPPVTSSIKVIAYYSGDTEPVSYTNGPFTVEFQREPLGSTRGSSLRHTRSGTQISLNDLMLSGQYTQLGTSPMRSSQLAAKTAATPAPWPAPAPRPTPASRVQNGPPGSLLDASDPTAFAGTWRVFALDTGYNTERTLSSDHIVTEGGHHIGKWEVTQTQLLVRFDVGGGVDAFDLPARNGIIHGTNLAGVALRLVLDSAPVLASVRDQVIGAWDRTDAGAGLHTVASFAEDGSYSDTDKPIGHWKIYGDVLLVNYNRSSAHDVYNLPVASDTLSGINNFRSALKLVRHTGPIPVSSPATTQGPAYFGYQ
jgi:hypothetical protein